GGLDGLSLGRVNRRALAGAERAAGRVVADRVLANADGAAETARRGGPERLGDPVERLIDRAAERGRRRNPLLAVAIGVRDPAGPEIDATFLRAGQSIAHDRAEDRAHDRTRDLADAFA